MRHAKFFAPGFFIVIQIDTNNHFCADHPQPLNHIQPDTAQTKYHTDTSGLGFRGINHRPNARCHPATDIANLVKRRGLVDFRNSDFRQYGKIGKCRGAHIMQDGFAIQ